MWGKSIWRDLERRILAGDGSRKVDPRGGDGRETSSLWSQENQSINIFVASFIPDVRKKDDRTNVVALYGELECNLLPSILPIEM